jgi:hypothetical protein
MFEKEKNFKKKYTFCFFKVQREGFVKKNVNFFEK